MKNSPYFHLFLVLLVGLIAYSNTFGAAFVFDDSITITDNPLIKRLDNFILLLNNSDLSFLGRYDYSPGRYIGYLTFAVNYYFGGLNVIGYHIVNLLIHITNGILVYFLVLLTLRTLSFEAIGDRPWAMGERQEGNHSVDYSPFTLHYSRLIALFSALLFVSHPIQTQAVTYIVQRLASLATMFYLASLVFYIKGRLITEMARGYGLEAVGGGNPPDRGSLPIAYRLSPIACFLFSLVSAVCAMKTKEISFTLPLMILLYEFTFFRSTLKRKLVFLVPILLTLIIIPLSMLHIDKPLGEVLSDLSEKSRLQTDMSRGDYLMTELRVIVTYIRLIFLPVNQNLDYDYPIYRSFFTPQVFLSFLLLSALFGTAVFLLYKTGQRAIGKGRGDMGERQGAMGNGQWAKDKAEKGVPIAYFLSPIAYLYRLIAFGILWFFITLSVESSFIPIVDVIFEHRLYLPSVGAFIALTAALFAGTLKLEKRWPQVEKAVMSLLLIIVAALSVATFARNEIWKDEVKLWEDVVKKSPGNARPHNNLGFLYNAKGMNDQAVEQFLSALRLRPDYLDARINLGIAYNARGMFDQAIEQFLMALSMNPDDADAHNNLGIAYVSKGMIDEGMRHYQIALGLQQDYAEAYNNLGVAYASKGMLDQAGKNFEHAILLKPYYFEAYYNLAVLYEKMGDHEKAADLFRKAKDIKPTPAP